jgi:hypothetical protein
MMLNEFNFVETSDFLILSFYPNTICQALPTVLGSILGGPIRQPNIMGQGETIPQH